MYVCLCVLWSSAAAVAIQQRWRKCGRNCENTSSHAAAGDGGDGGAPESGTSHIKLNIVGQHRAATVIQVKQLSVIWLMRGLFRNHLQELILDDYYMFNDIKIMLNKLHNDAKWY